MRKLRKGSRGFTLMELMVVVAILAVIMAIVAPAISGTKSQSTDGMVQSDGKATQTAVDNYNNRSIRSGQFPEVLPTNTSHAYADIFAIGAGGGASVTLLNKDGTAKGSGETLASKTQPSGTTAADAQVYKRRFFNFAATTDVYDTDGSVKTAAFVPDFLTRLTSSASLKGDETKALGAAVNTIEEYLWALLVNAPGTGQESRGVEVYRLTGATVTGTSLASVTSLTYTQIY